MATVDMNSIQFYRPNPPNAPLRGKHAALPCSDGQPVCAIISRTQAVPLYNEADQMLKHHDQFESIVAMSLDQGDDLGSQYKAGGNDAFSAPGCSDDPSITNNDMAYNDFFQSDEVILPPVLHNDVSLEEEDQSRKYTLKHLNEPIFNAGNSLIDQTQLILGDRSGDSQDTLVEENQPDDPGAAAASSNLDVDRTAGDASIRNSLQAEDIKASGDVYSSSFRHSLQSDIDIYRQVRNESPIANPMEQLKKVPAEAVVACAASRSASVTPQTCLSSWHDLISQNSSIPDQSSMATCSRFNDDSIDLDVDQHTTTEISDLGSAPRTSVDTSSLGGCFALQIYCSSEDKQPESTLGQEHSMPTCAHSTCSHSCSLHHFQKRPENQIKQGCHNRIERSGSVELPRNTQLDTLNGFKEAQQPPDEEIDELANVEEQQHEEEKGKENKEVRKDIDDSSNDQFQDDTTNEDKKDPRTKKRRRLSPKYAEVAPMRACKYRSRRRLRQPDPRHSPPSAKLYRRAQTSYRSPSSSLSSSAETSATIADAEYEEWPLQGFLKRTKIRHETTYNLEFNLNHTAQLLKITAPPQALGIGCDGEMSIRPISCLSTSSQAKIPQPPRLQNKCSPFTKTEDMMLVDLKENQHLPWKEINCRFPNRSVATLQVHYSTKLKNRPTTSTKKW
ncbi:MAG: hypothetical protein M1827_007202 [Pycnora praestabilis]|nr:MAG: hypothetical protein M1827_007202 [Pycnora praestabilis]